MAKIHTTKGDIEEVDLEKRQGLVDNDNEHTTWVEYWKDGELVHRSAHVTLKRPTTLGTGKEGGFNG